MLRLQRGVVWPYLLLSVALLAALGFGWHQTREKNQLALFAENRYMAGFHQLKWTSENIEERTALLMATNDPAVQERLLADIRVYSAQAVEHMSVLPVLTLNVPRITNFLNTLRNKSDEYHFKLSQGDALTAAEWDQLKELRGQAVFFEDELSNLLGLVSNNMIRWRDTVKATSPTQADVAVTPITQSVMQMEKALAAPPGEEKATAEVMTPMAAPKMDLGQRVEPPVALAAVKRWIDTPLAGEPKLTGTSDPDDKLGQFSLYFIDAQKANGTPLNFGVSVHGGHVVFMLDGRPVNERNFTQDQLVDRARQWLKKWGYPAAEFLSAADNAGTLIMTFAPRQNGVAIHTELIHVSLAMDNAEVVGFNARNYWTNRHPRNLSQPALSAAEARQRLAPHLRHDGDATLVVVADRRGTERLAWEFRAHTVKENGQVDQRYMIFVDAKSGQEINLLRLGGDPAPPMNAG